MSAYGIVQSPSFQTRNAKINCIKAGGSIILLVSLVGLTTIILISRNWSTPKLLLKQNLIIGCSSGAFLGTSIGLMALLHQTTIQRERIHEIESELLLKKAVFVKKSSGASKEKAQNKAAVQIPEHPENKPVDKPANCPVIEEDSLLHAVQDLRLWGGKNFSHIKNILHFALDDADAESVIDGLEKVLCFDQDKPALTLDKTIDELLLEHKKLIKWLQDNRGFVEGVLQKVLGSALKAKVTGKIDGYLLKVKEVEFLMKSYEQILPTAKTLLTILLRNENGENKLKASIDHLFSLLEKELFYAALTDKEMWQEDMAALKALLKLPLKMALANAEAPIAKKDTPEELEKLLFDPTDEERALFTNAIKKVQPTIKQGFLNVGLSGILGCSTILGIEPARVVSEQFWKRLFKEFPFLEGFCEKTDLKQACDEILRHVVLQLFVEGGAKKRRTLQKILHEELSNADKEFAKRIQIGEKTVEPVATQVAHEHKHEKDNIEKDKLKTPSGDAQKLESIFLEEMTNFLKKFTERIRTHFIQEADDTTLVSSPQYHSLQIVERRVKRVRYSSMTLLMLSTISLLALTYLATNYPTTLSSLTVSQIKQGLWSAVALFGTTLILSLIFQNRMYKKHIDFYRKNPEKTLKKEQSSFLAIPKENPSSTPLNFADFLQTQTSTVKSLEKTLTDQQTKIDLLKAKVGEENVKKVVTRCREYIQKQPEFIWSLAHQPTLNRLIGHLLPQNAENFRKLCQELLTFITQLTSQLAPVALGEALTKTSLENNQSSDPSQAISQASESQHKEESVLSAAAVSKALPLIESLKLRVVSCRELLTWIEKNSNEIEAFLKIFGGEQGFATAKAWFISFKSAVLRAESFFENYRKVAPQKKQRFFEEHAGNLKYFDQLLKEKLKELQNKKEFLVKAVIFFDLASFIPKLKSLPTLDEFYWIKTHAKELKKITIRILGEEEAQFCFEIAQSIQSLLFITAGLLPQLPKEDEKPQSELSDVHALGLAFASQSPSSMRQDKASNVNSASIKDAVRGPSQASSVVEDASSYQALTLESQGQRDLASHSPSANGKDTPFRTPSKTVILILGQLYPMLFDFLQKHEAIVKELAKAIGDTNIIKEVDELFLLLYKPKKLLDEYLPIYQKIQEIIGRGGKLIVALPQETEEEIKNKKMKLKKQTYFLQNLANLKTGVAHLQTLLQGKLINEILDTPSCWLDGLNLLFNMQILEKRFYLAMLDAKKSDQEITAALQALPMQDGRLLAMATKIYDVHKTFLPKCKFDYIPYTENFKIYFQIDQSTQNLLSNSRNHLIKIAEFLKSTWVALGNRAARFGGRKLKDYHKEIHALIEGILSKYLGPNLQKFSIDLGLKESIFQIVDGLAAALVEMPGSHFDYRKALLQAIEGPLEIWIEKIRVMLNHPNPQAKDSDSLTKVYVEPIDALIQSMLENLIKIKRDTMPKERQRSFSSLLRHESRNSESEVKTPQAEALSEKGKQRGNFLSRLQRKLKGKIG